MTRGKSRLWTYEEKCREKKNLGNRKFIIEQLNKYRRVSVLRFKVNNYYRQVQQMEETC